MTQDRIIAWARRRAAERTSARGFLRRSLARRATAGVTLVEVLIVVAIMAMIAGGVSIVALPKFRQAQRDTAKTSAQQLRRAIQNWQRVNNEITCPTHSQLIESREIDAASEVDDPWGQEWIFLCQDDEVYVQSVGPDKQRGTDDDISVPALRNAD